MAEERWRPIETAPKNGLPILIWDDYYFMRIAKWEIRSVSEIFGRTPPTDAEGHWITDLPYGDEPGRGEIGGFLDPTHWMPLPKRPEPPHG
jgi:hypothetical protein